MAAVKRDYYDVLGVSRDADEERIRRAFYAHAREWHPDVTETPEAEERFRELAEAYTVLSKREARLLYDRFGYRSRGSQQLDEALWETRPAEVVRGENIRERAMAGINRLVREGAWVGPSPAGVCVALQ